MKLNTYTGGKFKEMAAYNLLVNNDSKWLAKIAWVNTIRIMSR